MTKQSERKGSQKCASAAHSKQRNQIPHEISDPRKRWQTAVRECRRKQDRLVKRMLKQRLANDAEHQRARSAEKELRRRLHAIRVRRARKRDSLHALEKKLVARCLEIESITEEEAVEEAALTEAQARLQTIESRLEQKVREELSRPQGGDLPTRNKEDDNE